MLVERPLLGIGPGEFYKNYGLYKQTSRFKPLRKNENAHNYYIQVASETGLIGIGSFLAVLVGVISMNLGRKDKLAPKPDTATTAVEKSNTNIVWFRRLGSCLEKSTKFSLPDIRPGLLASIVGLCLFSLTQHPMLRFEFQLFFWIFMALVTLPPSVNNTDLNPSFRSLFLLPLVTVLVAATIQHLSDPKKLSEKWEYGFRDVIQVGESSYRQTEGTAFLHLSNPPESLSFQIRIVKSISTDQRVILNIGEKKYDFDLKGESSKLIQTQLEIDAALDLGIQSFPVLPQTFPDSWGGGVFIGDLDELSGPWEFKEPWRKSNVRKKKK